MEVEFNPWNVSSLEEFLFYNCPECESKYSVKEQFVGHAMVAHKNARDILETLGYSNDEFIDKIQTLRLSGTISFANCDYIISKCKSLFFFTGEEMSRYVSILRISMSN